MSQTSAVKYDGFCSKINDKTVDAIGHMYFAFDFDHFKPIEKAFCLIVKETNLVFKFKLVVKSTEQKSIKIKLIYLSEERIECKFEASTIEKREQKLLNIGDTLVKFVCKASQKMIGFIFSIGLSFDASKQRKSSLVSRKFNDQSSSDFIIECQNKKFYVHEMILSDQSQYFEAVLRNNCKENSEKKLVINDFEPKYVEVLLRYIYNDAVHREDLKYTGDIISILKIADKYNFTSLHDAIDSDLAQMVLFQFLSLRDKEKLVKKMLPQYVPICEETGAPKLSAAIFYWKSSMKDASGLSDSQWSALIRRYPNFALVAANCAGREDYQSWLKQHYFWDLTQKLKERNDFALIVGSLGRMKGATECSQN